MKGGREDLREIDRWDHGVGWVAHPNEEMQRASHALELDGEVWVIDPVDADGVDDLLADLGDVTGVVVGLDRHTRDAATLARRHAVPVYVPDWMSGVANKLNADVERFGRELGDTGVRALTVRDSTVPPWQEVGLYDESRGTLVVPEALGTAPYYLADGERLGVHPMIRLFPPTRPLSDLEPERILVSHGSGIHEDATRALTDALENSRRRTPSLYGKTLKMMVTG